MPVPWPPFSASPPTRRTNHSGTTTAWVGTGRRGETVFCARPATAKVAAPQASRKARTPLPPGGWALALRHDKVIDGSTIDSHSLGVRISELADRSGVSAASIKWYAREGLLAAGERTGYNQTEYGEEHLARLHLIRSLIEVGGLSVAAARAVLAAADDPDHRFGDTLGIAQASLPRPPPRRPKSRCIRSST